MVDDLELGPKTRLGDMVDMMGAGGGFTARALSDGVDIMETMHRDRDCFNILSFPACIIAFIFEYKHIFNS